MSKITLEDGAQIVVESIDCLLLNDANYEDEAETLHQIANLIRTAQKVVDSAEQIDGVLITFEGCLLLAVTPELVDDLKEKIAEFRKEEEGE